MSILSRIFASIRARWAKAQAPAQQPAANADPSVAAPVQIQTVAPKEIPMSELSNEVQRLEGFIDGVRSIAASAAANAAKITDLENQIVSLNTSLAGYSAALTAEQATNADLVTKLKAANDMLGAVVAPASVPAA